MDELRELIMTTPLTREDCPTSLCDTGLSEYLHE